MEALLFESELAAGSLEAPTITLYSAGKVVNATLSTMLITVQPGSYVLKFSPPASLTEQDDLGVIVSVQIAINTIASLQLEINKYNHNDCASSTFNDILISPNGYYIDGNSLASVSFSQLSQTHEIVRLPFTLDRFSVVYLQVGSQYLISELQARIYDGANTTAWHGRMRKNINEVHQVH